MTLKVGDLISFKPDEWDNPEWSSMGIIIGEYMSELPPLWKVWIEGREIVINEDDYQIVRLTSSLQKDG